MSKRQTLNDFPVERRKLAGLVKAPWNPRQMPDDQAEALKRSVQEFGTVEPIVVNRTTGNIVGGHMRLDALLALGETETDVVVVELTEEREKALNIALNRISGEWQEDRLGELLRELQESGDVGLTGFSQEELAELLNKENKEEIDSVPITSLREVVVECESEKEQERVFNQLSEMGLKCRILTL